MNSLTSVLHGRSLLGVFAHPDDESLACGGLLAWCAELGARVSILCATRGEMGRGSGSDLSLVRTNELAAAARALGVSDVLMLDYEDGMLPWAEPARLEADIRDATIRFRPDVVITFGEDGLYWHPDHIAIHERTTAAVAALGDTAPALYYVTMASGRMRAVIDTVAARIPPEGAPYQSWVCRMPMRSERPLRHPRSPSTCVHVLPASWPPFDVIAHSSLVTRSICCRTMRRAACSVSNTSGARMSGRETKPS